MGHNSFCRRQRPINLKQSKYIHTHKHKNMHGNPFNRGSILPAMKSIRPKNKYCKYYISPCETVFHTAQTVVDCSTPLMKCSITCCTNGVIKEVTRGHFGSTSTGQHHQNVVFIYQQRNQTTGENIGQHAESQKLSNQKEWKIKMQLLPPLSKSLHRVSQEN
jgi:hypothetical protein